MGATCVLPSVASLTGRAVHTDKISILFLPTHYMDGPLKGRVPHRLKQSAVHLLSPCLPEICHLS